MLSFKSKKEDRLRSELYYQVGKSLLSIKSSSPPSASRKFCSTTIYSSSLSSTSNYSFCASCRVCCSSSFSYRTQAVITNTISGLNVFSNVKKFFASFSCAFKTVIYKWFCVECKTEVDPSKIFFPKTKPSNDLSNQLFKTTSTSRVVGFFFIVK